MNGWNKDQDIPAFRLCHGSGWLLLVRFPAIIVNTLERRFRNLHVELHEVNIKLRIKEAWS